MKRLAALLCIVPLLSACSPGDLVSGCHSADDALVKRVMADARSDYEAGGPGGNRISHLSFLRAKSHDLPASLHKYGMSELVSVLVIAWSADEPKDSPFAGTHLPTMFAVSKDHQRVLPVEEFARDAFSVQDPALRDPGYQSWARSVERSGAGKSAYGCVGS